MPQGVSGAEEMAPLENTLYGDVRTDLRQRPHGGSFSSWRRVDHPRL